jgi:hypothetical protein
MTYYDKAGSAPGMRWGLPLLLMVLMACGASKLPLSVSVGPDQAKFSRTDGVLHISLEMRDRGIASIFVRSRDRLYVLHASAALGTGIYTCKGEEWRRVQAFAYRCRDNGDNTCRTAFRKDDGWIANVARGGADRHFEIDLARFAAADTQSLQIAVTYLVTMPPMPHVWPPGVSDDTGKLRIQQGFLPEIIDVRPERWISVAR